MHIKGQKSWTIAYITLALVEIIAHLTQQQTAIYILKPFQMLLLASWFGYNMRHLSYRPANVLLLGLLFSCLGDCLLMVAYNSKELFLLGLSAFLLTHVCYCYSFSHTLRPTRPSAISQHPWFGVPFIAYGAGLLYLVKNFLFEQGLFWAVFFYACIICAMAIQALNRHGRVPRPSYIKVFVGALVFMLSDSIIALNRFREPIPYANIWIMITYLSAQYLIVWGYLEQLVAMEKKKISANLE